MLIGGGRTPGVETLACLLLLLLLMLILVLIPMLMLAACPLAWQDLTTADVVLTTYAIVENEHRKAYAGNKVACPDCGRT